MKVFAIRHGLTELNKQKKLNAQIDEPLTKEGEKQAEEAIPSIAKSIKIIYSSPMIRAKRTAEIINSKLLKPLLIERGLTEIHMGSIAGKSWEELPNGLELKQKHRSGNFDYQSFGGESVTQVKKRLIDFLKSIRGKHSEKEVLIVTHGGIIRILYIMENNLPLTEEIGHISPYEFDIDKILKNN